MTDKEQRDNLDRAMNRFYEQFGMYPVFEGLSETAMANDAFIHKLDQAIANNDPEVDISEFLSRGRNL